MRTALLLCALLSSSAAVLADTLAVERSSWVSTGADNSLERARNIFGFKTRSGIVRTSNEQTNIHTHYKRPGFLSLRNYTYSGQFKLADLEGGIGVTFHSKYPREDTYYRLRRYRDEPELHLAPHGTEFVDCDTDTGVSPLAGQWYNFKVFVRTTRLRTRVRAKVWRLRTGEPRWQVDCSDASETRIRSGRVGLWSMATGEKRWRNLDVETTR